MFRSLLSLTRCSSYLVGTLTRVVQQTGDSPDEQSFYVEEHSDK